MRWSGQSPGAISRGSYEVASSHRWSEHVASWGMIQFGHITLRLRTQKVNKEPKSAVASELQQNSSVLKQWGKKLMIGLVSYHSCQHRCERSQSSQPLISSNCREANKSLIRMLACEWRVSARRREGRDGRRKPGKMRGILEQG